MTRLRLALVSLLLLGLHASAFAAASPVEQPKLVRLHLRPGVPVSALMEAGLDVVAVKGASEATILQWTGDDAKLARLGLVPEVLDEHPGETMARRSHADPEWRPAPAKPTHKETGPDGSVQILTAPPFGSGSMGGYWTSAEIKMKLDDLVAGDVNDVVADKIDTLGYSLGFPGSPAKPIWGLKLGKRVTGTDTRPVAYFSALTHAREPEGMQALFYFVSDLLSKYGTDPFATYLLDHRVIYICPLVNPDGYKINENDYFGGSGFGFWRKNARDYFDGSPTDLHGVDINRNYGWQWGLDNVGSSPTPSAENYRGLSAFSEPETRAQRDIVVALKPVTGTSFHTYADLQIHPWGYTTTPTPDNAAFTEWTDELTRDNAYLGGQAPDILYSVNGEFNDWCYGDVGLKPKMFSWTPEVGSQDDNFWPAPSRIVPLAQENLRSCYVVAAIAGPWVQEDGVSIQEGNMNAGFITHVSVRARNLGATGTAGPGLTGTLVPLDAGVRIVTGQVSYPSLGSRTSGDPLSPFALAVDDTVTPGRLMRFRVEFGAPDGFFSRDTIAIPAGTPTLVAFDYASSGLGKWTMGVGSHWGIVSGDANHPSRYFTDSPAGDYTSNARDTLLLTGLLNFSSGVHAYAFYDARWEFEEDYDCGQVEVSLTGTSYSRLWASGSTPGSGVGGGVQPAGVPVYAGSHRLWKPERLDLSAFAGPTATGVRLRFATRADPGSEFDGFSFDSLRIVVYDPAVQPIVVAVDPSDHPRALEFAPPSPNPVRSLARFAFALPTAGLVKLEILDITGRRVRLLADGSLQPGRYVRGWDLEDDRGNTKAAGVYFARLVSPAGQTVRRFTVLR